MALNAAAIRRHRRGLLRGAAFLQVQVAEFRDRQIGLGFISRLGGINARRHLAEEPLDLLAGQLDGPGGAVLADADPPRAAEDAIL